MLTTSIVFQQFRPQEHQNAYNTNVFSTIPLLGPPKAGKAEFDFQSNLAGIRSRVKSKCVCAKAVLIAVFMNRTSSHSNCRANITGSAGVGAAS